MRLPDKTSLHDYQSFSVKFIEDHPCSAVFLSCGMGKSIISLTAIADLLFDSFEISKALIIGPLRVAKVRCLRCSHLESSNGQLSRATLKGAIIRIL